MYRGLRYVFIVRCIFFMSGDVFINKQLVRRMHRENLHLVQLLGGEMSNADMSKRICVSPSFESAGSFTIKSNVERSRCLLSEQTRRLSSRTRLNVTRRIPSANIHHYIHRVARNQCCCGRIESLRVNLPENHATDLRNTSGKSKQLKHTLSLSPVAARRDS